MNMARSFMRRIRRGAMLAAFPVLVLGLVTSPAFQQVAHSATASDDFNRADGPLGVGWTDMSEGGLTITSQVVAGTNPSGNSGDIRTAETYGSDQYSQVQLTSTPIAGNQWIGPSVRSQGGGLTGYIGIYYGNGGNPELM